MTTYSEIPNYIRSTDLKWWRIRRGTKKDGDVVFESYTDRDRDSEINRMNDIMRSNFGDAFLLIGSQSESKHAVNNYFSIDFSNFRDTGGVAGIGSVPYNTPQQSVQVGYLNPDEVKKLIDLAVREERIKQEEEDYKDFLKQKREWEIKQNSGLDLILAKIGEYVPRMFPKRQTVGVSGQISGLNNGQIPVGDITNQNMNIGNLIEEWEQLDPEALQMIELIVNLCKNDFATYQMAKNMLRKM
ncbi:MAG: hypothetical protein LBC68_03770 [Prevotellaceae bacterium]|jgi:hypothetical protein|nr:hypothetical protein [Prevotellaceae bacterium]